MRKSLLFALMLFAGAIGAQPTIWGGAKLKLEQGDTSFVSTAGAFKNYVASYFSGGGTVQSVSVVSANGFAGTVANPTSTPAITLTTSITGVLKGNGTAISAATSGTDYSAGTSALATGILKSTTTTGTLSIAVAGDFPTLNQNTTGSAAKLTTPRAIYGNNFDGSAALTQIIASTFGGTGNGFTKFSGPATTEKTFTLPNVSAAILTDNAAVTAAQGGTGQSTYTIGDLLQASASTTLSKLAAVATGNVLISGGVGTVSSWGKVGLTTHVSGILPGANGGTNNGFMDFTGPTTTTKTFVLPNASATILTSNAAVTVAQGGTGTTTLSGTLFGNGTSAFTATALGGDVTLYGSNGTAPLYYSLGITTTSAAIAFARSSSTLNLNLPDADASFRGVVSTGTQTFAGAKTFSGAVTVSGLATASAGVSATATASVAAVNQKGVLDTDYRTVTATSTIAETDYVTYVGTLTADITLNLPTCNATRDGWTYRFMKKGTDAFAFILDPATTETFYDGATTKSYFGQGNSVTCQCESGSYWNILR